MRNERAAICQGGAVAYRAGVQQRKRSGMAMKIRKAPRSSGRPSAAQSVEMTERIIAGATQSFVERGYAGTTIQQLAVDVGVMRRSILQRFPTKDHLLIAVALRDTGAYTTEIGQLSLREASFERDFHRACSLLWRRGSDPKEAALLRAYFGEMGRLPELAAAIRNFYLRLAKTLEEKIRISQSWGWFPGFEASTVADCAISIIISTPRIRTMVFDPTMSDPVLSARHFENLWRFMFRMAHGWPPNEPRMSRRRLSKS
jgi:AcrR family transcriptional regulator